MRALRISIGIVLILFLQFTPSEQALAQTAEKVIVAIPSIGLSQLPLFVAQEKGFYKQEKLEALLVVMDGTIAARATIAGDIDFLLAFASGISAIVNGAPLRGVMGLTTRGTQAFVSRPEISSAADLKGKTIGVSGFGGSTYHNALIAIQHLGLDPKRDVSILNVGNSALRLTALRFNKIDATILDTAYVRKAEELGFKKLVSLADLGEIPSTGFIVTTKKLKEKPDQIRRIIRATLRGVSYFKKNRSEMIAFISRKLAVDSKEAEELFDLGAKVFSSTGRVSDEGLNVLLRQRDSKGARINRAEVVDWSFLPAEGEQ
ncbi:MAG: ABC transporter substrate-binding protein [Deltaproteobacteria bacterium]|nr:ABC transporter substrate-binding protein [Deltaproteobacteria bacterium]